MKGYCNRQWGYDNNFSNKGFSKVIQAIYFDRRGKLNIIVNHDILGGFNERVQFIEDLKLFESISQE